MGFLPDIAGLGSEKSKWIWLYLMGGMASWTFIQFFYVSAGKKYWEGFGPPGDPMNAGSQFVIELQQVAFWPIALIQTMNSTGMAGT